MMNVEVMRVLDEAVGRQKLSDAIVGILMYKADPDTCEELLGGDFAVAQAEVDQLLATIREAVDLYTD